MENTVTNRSILFVEDETSLLQSLMEYFECRGNRCMGITTLQGAKNALCEQEFDAVVLDLLLPDGNGLEIFENSAALPPVIVMSTLNSETDMINIFSAGAIDYVTKPCSPKLLEMHLALRMRPRHTACIEMHHVKIDVTQRTAHYQNLPLTLTGSEFNILFFLMTHAGVFFTSSQIYEHVWKAPSLNTTTIKYHISNLRRKLRDTTGKNLILTEFKKGYSFLQEETT